MMVSLPGFTLLLYMCIGPVSPHPCTPYLRPSVNLLEFNSLFLGARLQTLIQAREAI